jgi:hypothetical protein
MGRYTGCASRSPRSLGCLPRFQSMATQDPRVRDVSSRLQGSREPPQRASEGMQALRTSTRNEARLQYSDRSAGARRYDRTMKGSHLCASVATQSASVHNVRALGGRLLPAPALRTATFSHAVWLLERISLFFPRCGNARRRRPMLAATISVTSADRMPSYSCFFYRSFPLCPSSSAHVP